MLEGVSHNLHRHPSPCIKRPQGSSIIWSVDVWYVFAGEKPKKIRKLFRKGSSNMGGSFIGKVSTLQTKIMLENFQGIAKKEEFLLLCSMTQCLIEELFQKYV